MAYYVMANKATGHIQGINRPTLDRWPETDYYRFARDDLHNRQGPGELNERFHVGAGGDLIGPNTEVNLSAEGLVVSVVVEGAEPPAGERRPGPGRRGSGECDPDRRGWQHRDCSRPAPGDRSAGG